MKRKLIKQAGQAVTITLPIEWVRNIGVKAGDEVDLEMGEKDLIIRSCKQVTSKKTKIDMNGFNKRMKYIYINSAYAKGIDEIKIENCKIYPGLNQNVGYAIIDQKENNYTIKEISGALSENLDEVFKRVFQMIIRFYNSAINSVFGKEKEDILTVQKKDQEINKFTLFLQRSIMKRNYSNQEEGKIMFAFSFSLEQIGDDILRFWRTDIDNKIKKNDELKEIINISKESLLKAFEVYYHSSYEKVKELIDLKQLIREKASKTLTKNNSQIIAHAIKIVEESADLTHLSLMKKLKVKQ